MSLKSVRPSILQQLGYNCFKSLGSGTYGAVVECIKDGKSYAIKRMKFDEFVTNLPQELNVMAQVRSPYVMNIEDFAIDDTYIYLIMKKGTDFHKYIKSHKLTRDEQIKYMWELANGLYCLHLQGFYHCDLKLSNILLVDGSAVIGDLGLAGFNAVPVQPDNCTTLTERPPELLKEYESVFSDENQQWLNQTQYGNVIDVWSLGVVFASMLAGGDIFYPPDAVTNDIPEYIDLYLKHPTEYLEKIGVPDEFIPFIVSILNPDVNTRPTMTQILQSPLFAGFPPVACDKQRIIIPDVPIRQDVKNRISQLRLSGKVRGHTIHESINIYKRLAEKLPGYDPDLIYTAALQLAFTVYENNVPPSDILNIKLGYKDYFDFLKIVITTLNGIIGN